MFTHLREQGHQAQTTSKCVTLKLKAGNFWCDHSGHVFIPGLNRDTAESHNLLYFGITKTRQHAVDKYTHSGCRHSKVADCTCNILDSGLGVILDMDIVCNLPLHQPAVSDRMVKMAEHDPECHMFQ